MIIQLLDLATFQLTAQGRRTDAQFLRQRPLGSAPTLLNVWRNKESYNDTRIFHGSTPYDFGTYRGRRRSTTLIGSLRTHAPEYIEHQGRWYITSCGWPWVSSITDGNVAWASLRFDPIE